MAEHASPPDDGPLSDLEPALVWRRFDEIRRVPRPSHREKRIADYVRDWAAERGFAVLGDEFGNLTVKVPASPGREEAPTVVLQGHLDMVCEKDDDVEHDFDSDPIQVAVEDGWVLARGTTLGADNGLGVATAMAVADDPDLAHGPLELLFTLAEETGLQGASALAPELIGGRLLVNLDTEEDDAVYVGCAGAAGLRAELDLERVTARRSAEAYELRVDGLRGGHSGMEIHEGRGNALKVLGQLLAAAIEGGIAFDLVAIEGGGAGNAIPRRATAELRLDELARGRFEVSLETWRRRLKARYGETEPGLTVSLVPERGSQRSPISAADRDRLCRWLDALPHGVLAMSREVPELVETSVNLASVKTDEAAARILLTCRSSVDEPLAAAIASVRSLCSLAGAEVDTRSLGGYPGWPPEPDAPLVRQASAVYYRLFGELPAIKAVHAGIECGILARKAPGLQAVSIGPEIRHPHSPSETVRIASVAKLYRWLGALLDELS